MIYALLYALVRTLSLIPRPVGLRLGEGLGTLFYHLLKRRREIAFQNLTTAFGGQKTEAERRDLVRQCFRGIGRHFFEALYLFRFGAERVQEYVRFSGIEHYQQAKALGKGVAFLTGHFGCWELMVNAFGYVFDPTYVVVKPLDFEPAEKLSRTLREISGNRVVTKERSMRTLIRLLREGRNLGILMDQNIDWKDGVFVDFFGKRACTNKGLALLIKSTGAPVVPGFMIYEGQGRYRVEMQPALPWLDFDGDRTKEIEENTRQYSRVIEDMARRYPDHYFWVHQRWKTRPYQAWPRE
ncbi:MAG: lysophospholipid acyltransferase family protein [Desulfobacterota bacterium]|nr:lysophospholipid acyltransferase family protein [Thermodesulfobacteriota bacterium]